MTNSNKMMHTLYVCYFGLREPLVQTQVIPYLRQLSQSGIGVSLLTFEPGLWSDWSISEREHWHNKLKEDDIEWSSLAYHKRPSALATLYDIFLGAYHCVRQVRQGRVNVLHARSHMPLAMALLAKRFTSCKLVFDIRGLMADEYVDAGVWKEGSLVFRAIKWLEKAGVREANQIVVLTERMRDWLIENNLAKENKIEVIPCCADFSKYDRVDEEKCETESGRFEVIYAGSVTGLYLIEEMGRFFLNLRKIRKDAFLRVLTTSPASDVATRLGKIGLTEEEFWVGSVNPPDVPDYLRRASLGISFRKPTFSQIAASPTKIPEYLASGLPVICNSGIGDIDKLISKEGVGVIIKGFTDSDYQQALRQLEDMFKRSGLRHHCRKVAKEYFDLHQVGGVKYCSMYRRLV